jgi:hypothetical protein
MMAEGAKFRRFCIPPGVLFSVGFSASHHFIGQRRHRRLIAAKSARMPLPRCLLLFNLQLFLGYRHVGRGFLRASGHLRSAFASPIHFPTATEDKLSPLIRHSSPVRRGPAMRGGALKTEILP